MNGSTKLSLAIALALVSGGNAFALGLGAIQVKSGLNQPLNAEIAVIADSPAEAVGLNVSLARAEDFQRVGLDRARVSIPMDFEVITNGRQSVIHVTTKDPVREPFLDFLVEANWAKGRVLREYTVLLDPPVMAPALRGSTVTVAPAHETAPATSSQLPAARPVKSAPAPRVKPPRAVVETAPPPKPAAAPKPAPAPAPARAAGSGEYGPVAEGETLSEIARATKDDNMDTNAMMLALLQANPNAFYKDNINALKRGAILRIPSHDDVKAAGKAAAAAASVRDQNDAWKSGSVPVSKPTLVATTGQPKTTSSPAPAKSSSTKSGDNLALVPPASGKGSQSTADQPGSASGSGSTAGARGDIQRTKEALASREQEVGELKSRVKELEDINGKDQKLLTMRNSEIAELQTRLKELESKSGSAATAAKTPATATPATSATTPSTAATPGTSAASTTKPSDKITAQDIWGKINDSEKPKSATTAPSTTSPSASATPSTTSPSSTASTATPGSTTGTPPSTSATTTATTPSTTSSTTPSTATSSTTAPSTGTPSSSTATPSTSAPSATATPAPGSTTPSTTAATTTAPLTTSTTSAATPLTTPPSGTTTAPATSPGSAAATPISTPAALKPKPTTAITPIVPDQPWYQNTMTLAIAGGALLLVGLLALMRFMRRPKPVLLTETDGDVLVEEPHQYVELPTESEAELLDALAQHPGDPELSLKLLRLYYAERDASKFEAAAEAMYAHIADPTQPEWQEVKAMGEDLVPHNPLFGANDSLTDYMHESVAPVSHADEPHLSDDNFDLGHFDADGTPAAAEETFDFDLADHSGRPAAPVVEHVVEREHEIVSAPATLVPASKPVEDFFAGEDTIGTKLDLARAYLDMGDPEGARSMLDEVMSEGNDLQKGEARKLLAEIK